MTSTVTLAPIKSSSHSDAVKRFGSTEGLFRGTALISNLVLTALISGLPGMGHDPVLASTAIHFLFAASLEIPMGFLADRRGPRFAVLCGLLLKGAATSIFALVFFAASSGRTTWVFPLVVAEAICDGLANALLSGAWQVAFASWYGRTVRAGCLSDFFMHSLSKGLYWRLGIPTLAVLVFWLRENVFVVAGSLGVILALRLIVFVRVWTDLRDLPKPTGRAQRLLNPLPTKARVPFCALVGYTFIFLLSTSYLPSRLYVLAPGTLRLAMTYHLALYLILVLAGVVFGASKGRQWQLPSCALIVLLGSTSLVGQIYWPSVALIFFSMATLMIGSFMAQRKLTAYVLTMIATESSATWLSLAEALAMILFALISVPMLLRIGGTSSLTFALPMLIFSLLAYRLRISYA